ncbi:MAG: hypothetical protein KatS3mg044_0902 [Rhodothermaceae bacterium]|nr:MAG: hypothetical protein KatS3mg044_0902 [Rhodothermaceae bacterium]
MVDARHTPRHVTVDRAAQTLTIDWQDGHRSVYPLDGLRRACPCAGCQGHGPATPPDPALLQLPPRRRWESLRLEPVGNYALRFRWDDGHAAGIYTWQRLRALCPCPACTEPPLR